MNVKVVKFGGSSLADAKQITKAANIIKNDNTRRFVVPSAPGKRYSEDVKRLRICFITAISLQWKIKASTMHFSQ